VLNFDLSFWVLRAVPDEDARAAFAIEDPQEFFVVDAGNGDVIGWEHGASEVHSASCVEISADVSAGESSVSILRPASLLMMNTVIDATKWSCGSSCNEAIE